MAAPLAGLNAVSPGVFSTHGTAVSLGARGLLILGPSGAGKSGTAAMLLHGGAELIADDMVFISRRSGVVTLSAPTNAPALLELRGMGLLRCPLGEAAPLALVLQLQESAARLPEAEHLSVLGQEVPVVSHPYRFDLAAKIALWMAKV